ncbi:hypothetical protein RE428_10410 [Marinobacter nanhaiticus D15-8W]|uniref:Uncharacterized protein n=1 Tax=Marinobacter nanhaiticus D15-8W TaxID=626887 RepID=N6VXV6_9GAMM|nr:hypothetical protein [Marinobacter nanhaiticus]ENO12684.1 hypothetical protein J057_14820 [Marinobacter nanhaiticus D15-8W]BES70023.1 hypothetical protein RE428_10410 [Marinobacter nanhaiticus D15-8W]
MKFSVSLIFPMVSLLFLAGCASQQRISGEALSGVEGVYLITEHTSPKIGYTGPSLAWGAAIGGAIGGLLASQDDASELEIIEAFLEQQEIDLTGQANRELAAGLRAQTPRFEIVESYQDSDARFFLDSLKLSFVSSNPLTTSVMPTVEIKGSFLRNDGASVWEGSHQTNIYTISTEDGRNLEEWMLEPEFARQIIEQSVSIAVDGLVSDFAASIEN